MKKDLFKAGTILLAAALICSGCNQRPKVQENKETNSQGKVGVVEVGVFDAVKLKDQIVETIKSAPKPKELADFINESGISYMAELTLPASSVEKYMTAVEQSLAGGIYKFDALYAKAYDRHDVVLKLHDVIVNLNEKLGLEGELASMKKYDERIKKNSENTDSLNVIIPEVMNELAAAYYSGEHSGVYGLTYVAANIEGLYILSQVALMTRDNDKLIAFIGNQKERVKSNYMLLELMAADESVNPIFEKMKPILDYFTNNQSFTAKELAEVAPMIAQLRAEIVK
jgi:hypothetical protein